MSLRYVARYVYRMKEYLQIARRVRRFLLRVPIPVAEKGKTRCRSLAATRSSRRCWDVGGLGRRVVGVLGGTTRRMDREPRVYRARRKHGKIRALLCFARLGIRKQHSMPRRRRAQSLIKQHDRCPRRLNAVVSSVASRLLTHKFPWEMLAPHDIFTVSVGQPASQRPWSLRRFQRKAGWGLAVWASTPMRILRPIFPLPGAMLPVLCPVADANAQIKAEVVRASSKQGRLLVGCP